MYNREDRMKPFRGTRIVIPHGVGVYLARRWSRVSSMTLWMPSRSMSRMEKYWIPRVFRM